MILINACVVRLIKTRLIIMHVANIKVYLYIPYILRSIKIMVVKEEVGRDGKGCRIVI